LAKGRESPKQASFWGTEEGNVPTEEKNWLIKTYSEERGERSLSLEKNRGSSEKGL